MRTRSRPPSWSIRAPLHPATHNSMCSSQQVHIFSLLATPCTALEGVRLQVSSPSCDPLFFRCLTLTTRGRIGAPLPSQPTRLLPIPLPASLPACPSPCLPACPSTCPPQHPRHRSRSAILSAMAAALAASQLKLLQVALRRQLAGLGDGGAHVSNVVGEVLRWRGGRG